MGCRQYSLEHGQFNNFEDNLALNVHRGFVEGGRVRDDLMRAFVGQEAEWNPDEIIEEDHRKREQAGEGTFNVNN
jgi:hypothetical protein